VRRVLRHLYAGVPGWTRRLVILRFRGFNFRRPAARRERGVQERLLNVQRDKVGVIVFGNLLDVWDGLGGRWGEIRSK